MAIDLWIDPMSARTMWVRKYSTIRKKPLWKVLHDSVTPDDTQEACDDQTIPPRHASPSTAYERAKKIGQKEGTW
jgi:hypothetical protein